MLAAISAAVWSLYALSGETPPDSVVYLTGYSQSLFILYWLMIDARRRHRVPCHEFGFLVGLFMPVSLAWYLVWTRGLRGLLVFGGVVALWILPSAAWFVVRVFRFA
jgi:hypothetical protein